jgi:HAD superfamily hydrolase (TIGR01549 family)
VKTKDVFMAEKSKLYQKLIDKHQIISFDIFDTLLIRPYIKPSDIFFHLEKIYSLPGFAKHRMDTESSAREKTPVEEITYEAIYALIDKCYKTMKEKELAFEKRILQANPEMLPLFQYALENGKKVIIISDMYLPKTFLEQILNEKGYTGYFRFYLSSELCKTKSAGSLYTHVLSDLQCVSSALLHIGDNRHSDYLMPRKYGIHALHYQKLVGQLCAANKKTYIFYQKNPDSLGTSILLGILANGRVSQKHGNYFEQFGYEYGGAVVYAYFQWLKEQCTKDNIEEVLFVARDGYSLHKIAQMYNNVQGGGGANIISIYQESQKEI